MSPAKKTNVFYGIFGDGPDTSGKAEDIYGVVPAPPAPDPVNFPPMLTPEDFGIVWCDQCKSCRQGSHWIDHGLGSWRPGDPIPSATANDDVADSVKLARTPMEIADKHAITVVVPPQDQKGRYRKLDELKAYAARMAKEDNGHH